MSEIIPACSPNKSPASHSEVSQSNSVGVDLAPIHISPSKKHKQCLVALYLLLFFAFSLALLPTAFYSVGYSTVILFGVWVCATLALFFSVRHLTYAPGNAKKIIRIINNKWRFTEENKEAEVRIFADILVWSWVIILPMRHGDAGRKHYFVIFKDAVAQDDWRRLNLWLKLCYSHTA